MAIKALADWILDSEGLLEKMPYEDRVASVAALFAEMMMTSSVQGLAIDPADQRACRQDLAKHLVQETGVFLDEYKRKALHG